MALFSSLRSPFSLVWICSFCLVLLAGCGGTDDPDHEAASHEKHASEATDHAADSGASDTDEHAGHGDDPPARAVELTPEQVASLGIQIDTLTAGSASTTIQRPATVMFDLDRQAKQGPRVEAKVRRVTVDLGDRVDAGQTLAIMSSVELGRAKADYLTANAHLRTARREYEREQKLYADSISSEASMLEARAQFEGAQAEVTSARETLRLYGLTEEEVTSEDTHGEPLSHFHLRTPIAGVVQRRNASPGETIGSKETPFHVADPSTMWVIIDAYERDAAVLENGQPVQLTVRSRPSQTFDGSIDFVSYELAEETRTLRARAAVENADGQLRAGMFGQVSIQTGAEVARALVPAGAIQRVHGEPVVFVPGKREGHFRAVPVQTGEESQAGMVELVAGRQPGEAVVTKGAFDLKAALTSSGRSAAHSH